MGPPSLLLHTTQRRKLRPGNFSNPRTFSYVTSRVGIKTATNASISMILKQGLNLGSVETEFAI